MTEGPRKSPESAISINISKKSDNDQNLMIGVYSSVKTNSLTGIDICLFNVFDLSSPLNCVIIEVAG